MPPPVPPSVNEGRMMAGSPISSSASSAAMRVLTWCERGVSSPILVHRLAEPLAILGLVDGVGGRADHDDAASFQNAHAPQRQRGVERGLPAHGRQERVRTLLLDDLGHDLRRDRLDVGRVGQIRIGHDGRRIGIDENDPIALVLERLAGLRAGIVELAGLADDDRPRTDDQDRGDVSPPGHLIRDIL